MTAYNIVNPGSMVAGQPEDISQVLANFQTLATILNGNIDGANLKSFPNDVTKILRGDMSWLSPILLTSPNVGSANTDIVAPTTYFTIMNPSAGGGTVRTIAAPIAIGCRVMFQNFQASVITLKHQLAGGTGIKLFLANQADRVLGFGDSVEFYYDGTSWTEGNRMPTSYLDYTPTWTSTGVAPVFGNAAVSARYFQLGKLVHAYGRVTFGSTSTFGTGEWRFALPTVVSNSELVILDTPGLCTMIHGGTLGLARAIIRGSNVVTFAFPATYLGTDTAVTATTPWTWAVNDAIGWNLTYEAG